jgi:hypothetical protein
MCLENDEVSVMTAIGNGGVCFCLNMSEVYADGPVDWCATMVEEQVEAAARCALRLAS